MRHFDQMVMAHETRCATSTGGGVNAPVRPKGIGGDHTPIGSAAAGTLLVAPMR